MVGRVTFRDPILLWSLISGIHYWYTIQNIGKTIFVFRAENIDLDDKKLPGFGESDRTKQIQINEDTESFRTSVTPPAVEIDRDLLKDLEAEIMTMLTKEEGRQNEEVEEDKDYLDFDTDVITITMESDLSDLSRPWGPPVRQVRHRPGIRRPLPFFRRSQYPREVYYQYQ